MKKSKHFNNKQRKSARDKTIEEALTIELRLEMEKAQKELSPLREWLK